MKRSIKNSIYIFGLAALVLGACSGEGDVDPMEAKKKVLPILGERDIVYKTVDGVEVADTVYHHVPEFEYIDQDSTMKRSADFEGKVWIVDFFFSHCPSICIPMTANMKDLSESTRDLEKQVQYLSFSIDPDRDTPTRLREYIKERGINTSNWSMFTGDEEATHLMAKEFFNGAERNDDVAGGFGHTPYFALVDREGFVRGIYDGTVKDEMTKLENDLRKLLKDEYGVTGTK